MPAAPPRSTSAWPRPSLPLLSDGWRRVLWNAVIIGCFVLYFLVGRLVHPAATNSIDTAVDRAWPLVPEWMWIYSAVYAVAAVPGFLVPDLRVVGRLALGVGFIYAVASLCYVLVPVRMARPESLLDPHASFPCFALGLCWFLDPPNNCFPSLHVANAVFLPFVVRGFDKGVARVLFVLAGLIALSTLFTRQHYLADVAAGALLGWVAARFVAQPSGGWPADLVAVPRRSWLWVPGFFALYVGAVFVLYAKGWHYPWPGPFAAR